MQTSEALSLFLAAKEAKRLSPRTLQNYWYFARIITERFDTLPAAPEPLEAFITSRGPSDETRDTYWRFLRNVYRWLKRRRHIAENPFDLMERPVLPRKIPRSLTREQLDRLLHDESHELPMRALLMLLADTGIRIGEALSATADRFTTHTIIVSGKVGDREVPISPEVKQMVLDYGLPWPWSSAQAAGWAIRKAFRRAGFSGKRASAHTIRHTFARLWAGDETTLDGIMGWSTPRMRKVYRPYDVSKAVREHATKRVLALPTVDDGAIQLRLIH